MKESHEKLKRLKRQLAKLDAEAPDSTLTISEWRKRREAAEAQLKEAELAVRKGELLERSEVIEQVGSLLVNAKTCLRGIGAKIAPDLASETNAARCQAMIDAEIDEALTAASKWKPTDMPAK